MDIYILTFIGLFIAGLGVGIIAGLLGVGGGMVTVPLLFYVLTSWGYLASNAIQLAIASSMTIIVFTAFSSSLSHYKAKSLDLTICKKWVLWIIIGATFGGYTASHVDGSYLKSIFGIFALILALNMIRTTYEIKLPITIPKPIIEPLAGLGAFVSSWLGIGGGVFTVPLLLASGKSIHLAVGTSAAIGFLLALPASFVFLISDPGFSINISHSGFVIWSAVLTMVPASMLTAPLGAYYSRRLKTKTLKIVFSVFLLIVSINILMS